MNFDIQYIIKLFIMIYSRSVNTKWTAFSVVMVIKLSTALRCQNQLLHFGLGGRLSLKTATTNILG